MAPPHGGVMPLGDVLAGIGSGVTAQFIVARDLVGGEQGWCLQMARKVNETQIGARFCGGGDKATQPIRFR
jgi:hypothetical protein